MLMSWRNKFEFFFFVFFSILNLGFLTRCRPANDEHVTKFSHVVDVYFVGIVGVLQMRQPVHIGNANRTKCHCRKLYTAIPAPTTTQRTRNESNRNEKRRALLYKGARAPAFVRKREIHFGGQTTFKQELCAR